MYFDNEKTRAYIEKVIGHPDQANRSGDEDYRCPFCLGNGYANPSHLHINFRKGVAICHQCGYGAKSLINVVRALYGEVPRSLTKVQIGEDLFEQVLEEVQRQRAGVAEAAEPQEPVRLPDEFVPLSRRPADNIGRIVLRYLREERECTWQMLEEIGAGYCPTGWYRGYAIFPVHVGGELMTFTSRRVVAVDAKAKHATNSRSRLAIFNYDTAAAMGARRVFIGEGPFDGWAFHRRADPLDAGVGLLGKVLHDEQARLLDRLPCEELCMCLDDTEHERTRKAAEKLTRLTSKKISYILLKEGTGDPFKNRERLPRYVDRRTPCGELDSDVRAILA